jgi:RNA polymerase sigma-70 factor (ECF subfamily)
LDWFVLVLSAFPLSGDEAELARRLRAKDPQALTDLYDSYGIIVYRYVLRMVRQPSSSEDVVQETFSRVWHNSHLIDEDAVHIGPWVIAIARNLALDYLRSPAARALQPDTVLEQVGVESTAEKSLITEQNAKLVGRAIKSLQPNQRQVIELAYFNGLSQSQIAEQLNQPLGTVKSWTRMALVHLRSVLQTTMKEKHA